MFKVIIAGSRTFNDYELLKTKLDHILKNKKDIVIISGTANGADKLGERYAKEKGYEVIRMPANWELYGKRSGYIRNEEMAKVADGCVIFWDGISKGSKHMADLAEKYKLQLKIIKFEV